MSAAASVMQENIEQEEANKFKMHIKKLLISQVVAENSYTKNNVEKKNQPISFSIEHS